MVVGSQQAILNVLGIEGTVLSQEAKELLLNARRSVRRRQHRPPVASRAARRAPLDDDTRDWVRDA
jgi:hypothetical protein